MNHFTKIALISSVTMLSLSASDTNLSSIALGAGNAEFANNGYSTTNSYMHLDVFNDKSTSSLLFGMGLDIIGLGTSSSNNGNNNTSSNYTMGGQVKLGYSLYPLISYPIHIKTELGYGITRLNSANYTGLQYGLSLDAKLYKRISVGVAYKQVETGANDSVFESYTTNIAFMQLNF